MDNCCNFNSFQTNKQTNKQDCSNNFFRKVKPRRSALDDADLGFFIFRGEMKNHAKRKRTSSICPYYQEHGGFLEKVNTCLTGQGGLTRMSSVTEETAQKFCLTANNYHNCSVYKKYQ